MNYYAFHPGDYMLDTVHLEPLEDLCYRRLLDLYYISDGNIPKETDLVSRRLRLDESLVSKVLGEFFQLTENGWKHSRCDKEIATYQGKVQRAKVNGSQGGRPKKTDSVIARFPKKSESKANQEPITNNQSTTAKAVGRIAARSPQLADSDWLKDLASDPAYTGLNVDTEFAKMQRWCETNRKLPSRKRFVNWLNRAEKPMQGNGSRPPPKHAAYNAETATLGLTGDQIGKF